MWSQMDGDQLQLGNQSPEHSELMNRLRKTLYYGGLKMPQCKVLTKPLSDLVCNRTFDETHPENKLAPETVGQIKASPCSLILALIYLDLLKELDSQYVRRVPPSDLLLVAMMVATKFYSGYDEDLYISDWAEYGNMAVDRLKALELEFLVAMDWKIYVSNEAFFKKLKNIEAILAEQETRCRSWLTYTELCTLMPSIEVIRRAISYSALLAVSYTAGVIALAGAFFVASQVPGSYLCKQRISDSTGITNTSNPATATIDNVTATEATTDAAGLPSNGATLLPRNFSDMTELEQRLILSAVEWDPMSSAADDNEQQRIRHLNSGTDWTGTTTTTSTDFLSSSESNDSRRNSHAPYERIVLVELAVESLVHGIIRKKENDSLLQHSEWSPYQMHGNSDLSFLSYLWLKFS